MSYKVFTNASPLPASDLNTFLMNQSVITFANATERDATLTAPTEGMCVFLENNNHFQIYYEGAWQTQNPINAQGDIIVGNASGQPSRLAVGTNGSIPRVASGTLGYLAPGTNGQVLSISGGAPTWTTPAGGGGWDLLSTTTLTGSATVNITSISTAYKNLRLVVHDAQIGSSDYFLVQVGDGTTARSVWATRSTQALTWSILTGTDIEMQGNNEANTNTNLTLDLINYSRTGNWKNFLAFGSYDPAADTPKGFLSFGSVRSGNAINYISIRSGVSFTAGTALIYGGN